MLKMSPVTLALAAAFCWGLAPLFGKAGLEKADPLTGLAVRTFFASGAVLLMVLVRGQMGVFGELTARTVTCLALEGLLASFAGQLIYFSALKVGEASRLTPVAACFPVFTFIGAVLVLGEKFTPQKLVGLVLIVGGVMFMRW